MVKRLFTIILTCATVAATVFLILGGCDRKITSSSLWANIYHSKAQSSRAEATLKTRNLSKPISGIFQYDAISIFRRRLIGKNTALQTFLSSKNTSSPSRILQTASAHVSNKKASQSYSATHMPCTGSKKATISTRAAYSAPSPHKHNTAALTTVKLSSYNAAPIRAIITSHLTLSTYSSSARSVKSTSVPSSTDSGYFWFATRYPGWQNVMLPREDNNTVLCPTPPKNANDAKPGFWAVKDVVSDLLFPLVHNRALECQYSVPAVNNECLQIGCILNSAVRICSRGRGKEAGQERGDTVRPYCAEIAAAVLQILQNCASPILNFDFKTYNASGVMVSNKFSKNATLGTFYYRKYNLNVQVGWADDCNGNMTAPLFSGFPDPRPRPTVTKMILKTKTPKMTTTLKKTSQTTTKLRLQTRWW